MYARVRKMRENKNMTQMQVASVLRIHQTTYSDYELGKLNIPTTALVKLATLFETSVDYLLENTDTRDPYPQVQQKKRNFS